MAKLRKVIQNPEALDPNMKLKVSDVKQSNPEVIRFVAAQSDRTIAEIEDVLSFIGQYTADVVREGTMETVMLPYFGKITPNIKMLQAKVKRIRAINNRSYLLDLALRGKNVNFVPQINPISHELSTPTSEVPDQFDQKDEVQAPEKKVDD